MALIFLGVKQNDALVDCDGHHVSVFESQMRAIVSDFQRQVVVNESIKELRDTDKSYPLVHFTSA